MYKKLWNFLVVTLALSSYHVDCQVVSVSWIYQGSAQQNNSALTFNNYDTLNLICRATTDGSAGNLVFAVSKGSIPTGMSLSSGIITLKNAGIVIYTDLGGIQPGYENFIIYGSPYNGIIHVNMIYDFRYVNVGTLKTADAGIYSCSVAYLDDPPVSYTDKEPWFFGTSGRLTITVNTKSDQAHSSRALGNRLVTYAAAFMCATKFIF